MCYEVIYVYSRTLNTALYNWVKLFQTFFADENCCTRSAEPASFTAPICNLYLVWSKTSFLFNSSFLKSFSANRIPVLTWDMNWEQFKDTTAWTEGVQHSRMDCDNRTTVLNCWSSGNTVHTEYQHPEDRAGRLEGTTLLYLLKKAHRK